MRQDSTFAHFQTEPLLEKVRNVKGEKLAKIKNPGAFCKVNLKSFGITLSVKIWSLGSK